MTVFIPTATAGLALESALRSVAKEEVKRQRQVKFRGAILALQVLGVLNKKEKAIGIAEGCNYLGEKGFWIVMEEAQREVVEGPKNGGPALCGLLECRLAHTCTGRSDCPYYFAKAGDDA